MKEQDLHNELASIRNLMEKSSKFISLSGLSGVLAGVYALAGAAAVKWYINYTASVYSIPLDLFTEGGAFKAVRGFLRFPITIALSVLVASLITGLVLAKQKSKKKDQPIWGEASKQLLFNMAVPLFAGGILAVILLLQSYIGLIAPTMLVFYGVALVSASNFTYRDVRYLGLLEILLGLITAYIPGYGLYFWALGFGVLHIIYGSVVYFKYDR